MMKRILNDLSENLILALFFCAIELKYTLKTLAIYNGLVTVAPLCVCICIFNADECFKLLLKNRSQ